MRLVISPLFTTAKSMHDALKSMILLYYATTAKGFSWVERIMQEEILLNLLYGIHILIKTHVSVIHYSNATDWVYNHIQSEYFEVILPCSTNYQNPPPKWSVVTGYNLEFYKFYLIPKNHFNSILYTYPMYIKYYILPKIKTYQLS